MENFGKSLTRLQIYSWDATRCQQAPQLLEGNPQTTRTGNQPTGRVRLGRLTLEGARRAARARFPGADAEGRRVWETRAEDG